MFPSGRPGIALVILRLCLVGILLLHANRSRPLVPLTWSIPVFLLIATALCLGVATVTGCVVYCAAEIGFAVTAAGFDASGLILSIPVAIALLLLGPGAYSLDARIFGRRVIVIPPLVRNDK
jgi:hypothetical protein